MGNFYLKRGVRGNAFLDRCQTDGREDSRQNVGTPECRNLRFDIIGGRAMIFHAMAS